MIRTPLPIATFLVVCYNQQHCIRPAIEGALSQDYLSLEIIIADDASTDATPAIVEEMLAHYSGPHRVRFLRNPINLGVGGNIDHAVRESTGEVIFIAGGDDISLPERVSRVVDFWLANDKEPDLIGAYLVDTSESGETLGVIRIDMLDDYKTLDDWSNKPPHVIGAAQAWTRRLFDHFGGIPKGVVGEDMLMAFRAIASGGARTLPVPLVHYRRGGLTSKRRAMSATEVIRGLTRKLGSSRIELRQMLQEARQLGASVACQEHLEWRLAKEDFVAEMFDRRYGLTAQIAACLRYSQLPADFRVRILAYAVAPWLMAPFFYLKRLRHCSS